MTSLIGHKILRNLREGDMSYLQVNYLSPLFISTYISLALMIPSYSTAYCHLYVTIEGVFNWSLNLLTTYIDATRDYTLHITVGSHTLVSPSYYRFH
jgi:hypothetical protein